MNEVRWEQTTNKCKADGEKHQLCFEVDVVMPAAKNCCEGDRACAGADKIEGMLKKKMIDGL